MKPRVGKLFLFEMVYLSIAITTFNHTSWAVSTVFEGPMPGWASSNNPFDGWWLTGRLMAVAIDVGMFIVARFLTEAHSRTQLLTLITAFALLAAASFYMQILYAVTHTQLLAYQPGVTSWWEAKIRPLTDARVILLPLMLPLFAIVYTAAMVQLRHEDKREKAAEEEVASRKVWRARIVKEDGKPFIVDHPIPALPPPVEDKVDLINDESELGYHCLVCGHVGSGYKTPKTRRSAIKTHFTIKHTAFADWRGKETNDD